MEVSNQLCRCDDFKRIAKNFVPYSLGTINPYRKPMTRMDGSLCECDEFPLHHLYRKLFRYGDKSGFETGTTVKLPPYWIEWRQRPIQLAENRFNWPKALLQEGPVCKRVLPHERKPNKALKHEKYLRFYAPPKPEFMNTVYY